MAITQQAADIIVIRQVHRDVTETIMIDVEVVRAAVITRDAAITVTVLAIDHETDLEIGHDLKKINIKKGKDQITILKKILPYILKP